MHNALGHAGRLLAFVGLGAIAVVLVVVSPGIAALVTFGVGVALMIRAARGRTADRRLIVLALIVPVVLAVYLAAAVVQQ